MDSQGKGVNVVVSEKAAAFIKSRRLLNPIIMVNLSSHSGGGDSCGDGCGGGGCDDGKAGPKTFFANTILVDGGTPNADFVRVDTGGGIPVYVGKRIYEAAKSCGATLVVNVRGLVLKKLSVDGLDSNSLSSQEPNGKTSCH